MIPYSTFSGHTALGVEQAREGEERWFRNHFESIFEEDLRTLKTRRCYGW